MNSPTVSVLMTAYNREKYIAEAIESVLASTFTDFELIIVDDCSNDRTVEIAKSYAAGDPRVSVHVNEKNLGDYANRNKAATYARGRYLKYVDSDDVLYSHCLVVMVSMMDVYPEAGYGLSCSRLQDKPFPILKSPREAYRTNYFLEGLFSASPLSAIIKKSIFAKVGGFPEIRMAGDFAMWHLLSQSHSVVLMPAGLAWYRVHEKQEMVKTRKHPFEYELLYNKVAIDALASKKCPLTVEERKEIFKSRQAQGGHAAIRSLLKSRVGLVFRYLRLRRRWRELYLSNI